MESERASTSKVEHNDHVEYSNIASPHSSSNVKNTRRGQNLTLDLENKKSEKPRRHFFEEEAYGSSFDGCRIPKPHFLENASSPDDFDDRSDITNPNFLDNEPIQQLITPTTAKRQPVVPSERNFRNRLSYDGQNSFTPDRLMTHSHSSTSKGTPTWSSPPDFGSIKSFSSSTDSWATPVVNPKQLNTKMDCVYSLLSLLSVSPQSNADLSKPLFELSRSVDSCIAMRQSGCIPLLVQMIHSEKSREAKNKAAQALQNIIHTHVDDKAGRREARVWKLLEQVREFCYILEDVIESRKAEKEVCDDMENHPTQSVAALMKLSFDEEHRHVVCQLGGLQALATLVSIDHITHGSLIDDSSCVTMRKYAGMTLTNLTFGDGNNKTLLCSFKNFMCALVEQLQSPNDDMRQVTSAVLRNLSWRADSNSKQILREVGAVKGLTTAAMSCQKEATLKSILSALWNLTAHCSTNKVALCSVEGALGFLVDMLSYNSQNKTLAIVENAGGIMRNVSSHIAIKEDYRQLLRERNCLSVLLHHLKSPSLTVVSNACGTLWNLSARCPQDQQFLWDHGAVPMLRSLIHSKHKMIAMGSSAALKNLLNSKVGKNNILSLDVTARNMNLPALPTLGARKQKALEQEIDQNLAETCDNIEPATSPTVSNRAEKNLYTASERRMALNLERHRLSSSSPLMSNLTCDGSLSQNSHLASYLSCSNTLLRGNYYSKTLSNSNSAQFNMLEGDFITSIHSDSVFERMKRIGKVPIPTPRTKSSDGQIAINKPMRKFNQPPIPPPRNAADIMKSSCTVDQESCDQPVDYSRKFSEKKSTNNVASSLHKVEENQPTEKTPKNFAKEEAEGFGDYQETDLDQPTDYSLRYAENQSETNSDFFEPTEAPIHDDTIKHFCTEGTPYETPIIFSTATSMSDLRAVGKATKPTEIVVQEDITEKPMKTDSSHKEIEKPKSPTNIEEEIVETKNFHSKLSSGMMSPEKPINYCDEGTPGYFSRFSSLSSLEEGAEGQIAKKNVEVIVHAEGETSAKEMNGCIKEKDGDTSIKAVTFASSCQPDISETPSVSGGYIEETPLMFSRCSSLGSISGCSGTGHTDHESIQSEISRLTSGCISPSEIPDSPGAPLSPTRNRQPIEKEAGWSEGASCLSPLTIEDDDASKPTITNVNDSISRSNGTHTDSNTLNGSSTIVPYRRTTVPFGPKQSDIQSEFKSDTGDSCKVYYTEDTPAILSKAGSNTNLSVLSIETSHEPAERKLEVEIKAAVKDDIKPHDSSSDSSNLSDTGENVLVECIQKGIAKVVKHTPSDSTKTSSYNSLPPYLNGPFQSFKRENPKSPIQKSLRLRGDKKLSNLAPTRAPDSPPAAGSDDERILKMAIQSGITKFKERKTERKVAKDKNVDQMKSQLDRNDSLSSLSVESYDSADREIFERCVRAGVNGPRHKSLERPGRQSHTKRFNKSLDRNERSDSDSLSNDSFGSIDREVFERSVKAGIAEQPKNVKMPSATADIVLVDGVKDVFGSDTNIMMYQTTNKQQVLHPNQCITGNMDSKDGNTCSPAKSAPQSYRCNDVMTSFPMLNDSMLLIGSLPIDNESVLPDLLEERTLLRGKRYPDIMPDMTHDVHTTIEKEAAHFAEQLKHSDEMAMSKESNSSLIDNIKPPSNMGSLLSLTQSGQWDDVPVNGTRQGKSRKKSFPMSMLKKATTNSFTIHDNDYNSLHDSKQSDTDNLIDLESSMISVASIQSEIEDFKARTLIDFDFNQPVSHPKAAGNLINDLDQINPPSLFDELIESTLENDKTLIEDSISIELPVLHIDEMSQEHIAVEESSLPKTPSTPLTPRQKRQMAKERYQTYTIYKEEKPPEVDLNFEDRPETNSPTEHAGDEPKEEVKTTEIKTNTYRKKPEGKKSIKQRRLENSERYRTRIIEDIPPPPSYVVKEYNIDNAETTTGYDSLSSAEFNHQQLNDDISNHGNNKFNYSEGMCFYSRKEKELCESSDDVNMCAANNKKNIEMTAAYRSEVISQNMQVNSLDYPSSSPESGGLMCCSDSENENIIPVKTKPKIVIPIVVKSRKNSIDSTISAEEEVKVKAIRGRVKAPYVSPYRRTEPAKSKVTSNIKTNLKFVANSKVQPKESLKAKTNVTPLVRQGTFTKEDGVFQSGINKNVPKSGVKDKKNSKLLYPNKVNSKPKSVVNSKPSPLPSKKLPSTQIKSSPSNQSLHSNGSGKTIILSKTSSPPRKSKDVTSKIANLWKNGMNKSKCQQENESVKRIVRSSTFDSPRKEIDQVVTATKQKSSIAMRATQIPKYNRTNSLNERKKVQEPIKQTNIRAFTRKTVNQVVVS